MIPVNKPLFISNEEEYLSRCIRDGWVSSEGPFVKEFESGFSRYVGKEYGVAVSSGTAALEIAMGAIDLKPGEEVIMPTFTIMSCALAVLAYGAKPVFVDSDSETWTMNVDQIEEKITSQTRAIMAVHIYGHPCDMDRIREIAARDNLIIIEDAAEAHGAEYRGQRCGGFGDISCFSFYVNKVINTGEGGMVLTNNEIYAERARSLRNLGFGKEKRFHHERLARNYRMTNLQAAVGVAQLQNIEKLIEIKRRNAARYTELLEGVEGIQLPQERDYAKNIYWMYGIVLDEATGFTAESFAEELAKEGVDTRPFFHPLHLQGILEGARGREGEHPVAERIARQGLYIPSGLGLEDSEIETVSRAIRKLLM